MSMIDQKLSRLAKVIEHLPEPVQADILADIEARIASLEASQMSEGQRAIVATRMVEHREYASEEEVNTLFARYRPRA